MRGWIAALAAGTSLLADAAAAQPAGGDLVVQVQGLRNGNGQVACALFASADGFPGDRAKAVRKVAGPIAAAVGTCRFAAVPPGVYAIAVIHDENGNGKMDKNFMGLPSEGFGASNDPQTKFGPPKYADAQFTHAAAPQTLVVHVRYLP
jgi:uncharacterized protein (DUF2141 family)